MTDPNVVRFAIDGQEVTLYHTGEDRLWRCACERFQLNLRRFNQGFCPHTAAAIMCAMQDGTISLGDPSDRKSGRC